MALTEEETYKVERWLKRKHVNVEEVAGFTFMQYYKPRPSKCKPYWRCLYGLGVFIFTLKSGFVRGTQHARHVVEYGASPESGLDCAISAGTEDSFYQL